MSSLLTTVPEGLLSRSIRMTAELLLLFLVIGWLSLGIWPTLAIFFGGVWSVVNIFFTTKAVRELLRTEGPDKLTVAGILLLKFPVLYLAGYSLLKVPNFAPIHLLIGFSVFFAVIILKVIGRALLRMDDSDAGVVGLKRESILR